MKDINKVIQEVQDFNTEELKIIADKILLMLHKVEHEHIPASDNVVECRCCHSKDIIKSGKDKNGKQRYKCKCCCATFTATSYSAIAHSHCSIETWERYIKLLLSGASLAKCSDECGISVRTAFIWRHKILSVLERDQTDRVMNGIVEIDDMFFSISYKGNHKNSKSFTMPRPAYKRGTDNRSPIGRKACVMCAVERKGHVYGEVLGVGTANEYMLNYAFKNRVLEDTVVVTDKAHQFKRYFSNWPVEHVQVAGHVEAWSKISPPEVKGVYHIQNINNLHRRFRRFLRGYNGVATKYLNNYLSLYIWIENHKNITNVDLNNELFNSITEESTYTPAANIFSLPPIPKTA